MIGSSMATSQFITYIVFVEIEKRQIERNVSIIRQRVAGKRSNKRNHRLAYRHPGYGAYADDDCHIVIGNVSIDQFDAPSGVTITAGAGKNCRIKSCTLPSGGTLLVKQR